MAEPSISSSRLRRADCVDAVSPPGFGLWGAIACGGGFRRVSDPRCPGYGGRSPVDLRWGERVSRRPPAFRSLQPVRRFPGHGVPHRDDGASDIVRGRSCGPTDPPPVRRDRHPRNSRGALGRMWKWWRTRCHRDLHSGSFLLRGTSHSEGPESLLAEPDGDQPLGHGGVNMESQIFGSSGSAWPDAVIVSTPSGFRRRSLSGFRFFEGELISGCALGIQERDIHAQAFHIEDH